MDTADNGLKVRDVEGPRVETPVPANHVEGMMLVGVGCKASFCSNNYVDLFAFFHEQLVGGSEIAFTVWSVFKELALS